MKHTILTFSAVSALTLGLSLHAETPKKSESQRVGQSEQSTASPDADNTSRNQRDRNSESRTPEDQSNSPQDLEITKNIRQSLVKNDSLSQNAKNVKIITVNGGVTLRGVVNSTDEKSQVEQAAQKIAGQGKVQNQLEVKTPQ